MAMIKIETVDGKVNVAIGHATGTELIIEATSAVVSTINALIDELDDQKEKEKLAQFAFEKITMGSALLCVDKLGVNPISDDDFDTEDDDDIADKDFSDSSAIEQALLNALRDMKKDDDEGTIDDLPMF
jgi:hypothetical protein